MPACPKCGAIGTTGPKGKWRCTSEKCEDKQRESKEAARRRDDKLECPKCGKEAREWNNELRCWSCGHVIKKTKTVEKRIEEVAKNKREAKDYKDSERAERLKREDPDTPRPWLGGFLFVFFGLVAAGGFMAAFADNDTLSDQNFVPALIGLIASLIALYVHKLFWGNWGAFFIFLFLMIIAAAMAAAMAATGDSRREFFDR